jgi:hypothetical protein
MPLPLMTKRTVDTPAEAKATLLAVVLASLHTSLAEIEPVPLLGVAVSLLPLHPAKSSGTAKAKIIFCSIMIAFFIYMFPLTSWLL